MANSFTWDATGDNADMATYGLKVVGIKGIGSLPGVALDLHPLVGADGAVDDGVRFEARHIEVDVVVVGVYDAGPPVVSEWQSSLERARSIAALLQTAQLDNEPKSIAFDCIAGYQWFGRPEGQIDPELLAQGHKATLRFVCPQPWAEATTETEETWDDS